MTRTISGSSRLVRALLVIGAMCVVVVLGGPVAGQDTRPTHASGRILAWNLYEQRSEDPSFAYAFMSDAVITVRMRYDGTNWWDAGSSFAVQYSYAGAPYFDDSCYIAADENYWSHEARFDAVDPRRGYAPGFIALTLDEAEDVAWLQTEMWGDQYLKTYELSGTTVDGKTCNDANGGGRFVLDWGDSLGAVQMCPIAAGVMEGRMGEAGRIDFACSDDQTDLGSDGPIRQLASVQGTLRLTP